MMRLGMWNLKSGDLTRIRGQNGPGDDYLAAAAWHSTVYGATKREKSPSTQLNLSLVEKKLDLRFQTSLYFKLKLLSRTMSLLSYTSDRPKIRFGQTFWQCLVSSVSDKEWKNFASSVVPIFAIFWIKMYWFFHEIPIWIFSIRKWEYVHFFQVRFNYPTRPNKGQ